MVLPGLLDVVNVRLSGSPHALEFALALHLCPHKLSLSLAAGDIDGHVCIDMAIDLTIFVFLSLSSIVLVFKSAEIDLIFECDCPIGYFLLVRCSSTRKSETR